jgi:hypothetical protein
MQKNQPNRDYINKNFETLVDSYNKTGDENGKNSLIDNINLFKKSSNIKLDNLPAKLTLYNAQRKTEDKVF